MGRERSGRWVLLVHGHLSGVGISRFRFSCETLAAKTFAVRMFPTEQISSHNSFLAKNFNFTPHSGLRVLRNAEIHERQGPENDIILAVGLPVSGS